MKRTVQDVMTRTVVVVTDSAPFKEVVRRMQEYRVSALPVVDADDRVVGVVSEGDLILKEDPELEGDGRLFEGRRLKLAREKAAGLVAAQLMTTPPVTIGPEATLGEAARLMHRRRIKRVPVVDPDRRILGIVSRADLLKVFLRSDGEIHEDVVHGVIQRALWIDPATIRVEVRDGVVRLEGQVERESLIPVLVGLVLSVEGVVGVENRLSFLVADTAQSPDFPVPWTGLAQGSRPR